MENIIKIHNENYLLRYVAQRINFFDALQYTNDDWQIPTNEQWDNLRDNYHFKQGAFSVEGDTIYLPMTGTTITHGWPYTNYWCANGISSFAFDKYGSTFHREQKEWHNSLVVVMKL